MPKDSKRSRFCQSVIAVNTGQHIGKNILIYLPIIKMKVAFDISVCYHIQI